MRNLRKTENNMSSLSGVKVGGYDVTITYDDKNITKLYIGHRSLDVWPILSDEFKREAFELIFGGKAPNKNSFMHSYKLNNEEKALYEQLKSKAVEPYTFNRIEPIETIAQRFNSIERNLLDKTMVNAASARIHSQVLVMAEKFQAEKDNVVINAIIARVGHFDVYKLKDRCHVERFGRAPLEHNGPSEIFYIDDKPLIAFYEGTINPVSDDSLNARAILSLSYKLYDEDGAIIG